MSVDDTGLARAYGPPVLDARIRTTPDDFVVDEVDAFPASGSGEHLLLTVRKHGMNTAFAAKRIAQWADVAESAIGYAGLKDRHASTRQRFSVWLPKKVAPDISGLQDDELQVLDAQWHARKLPRGALAGNRFVVTLRDVHADAAAVEARLRMIAARGVPNYFGEQRFGRGGDNIAAALAMFAGRRVRREQRSILLSAARSQLFNQILDARVRAEVWDQPLPGEVWILDGSRSVFGPEVLDDVLRARLAAFDIHPSGALWGAGELRSTDTARTLELGAIADAQALRLRAGLERAELKQERRASRLIVAGLQWRWLQDDALQLEFQLPSGSYATAVLDEIGTHRNVAPADTAASMGQDAGAGSSAPQ